MIAQYIIRKSVGSNIGNRFDYWYQDMGYSVQWNGLKENAYKMSYGESRSVLKELISKNKNQVYHRERIRSSIK